MSTCRTHRASHSSRQVTILNKVSWEFKTTSWWTNVIDFSRISKIYLGRKFSGRMCFLHFGSWDLKGRHSLDTKRSMTNMTWFWSFRLVESGDILITLWAYLWYSIYPDNLNNNIIMPQNMFQFALFSWRPFGTLYFDIHASLAIRGLLFLLYS